LFAAYSLFTDINTTALPVLLVNGTLNFTCMAVGYPDLQLVQWLTGSGEAIPESYFSNNTESIDGYNGVILESSLLMENDETCARSQGYICHIRKGGSHVIESEIIFDCPPSKYDTVRMGITALDILTSTLCRTSK
jgi:hypothetical protein